MKSLLQEIQEELEATPIAVKAGKMSANAGHPPSLRAKVLKLHYDNNISLFKIATLTGNVSRCQVFNRWKKTSNSKETTGYTWGASVRLDVRSKCLIVAEHYEEGVTWVTLGERHNIPYKTLIGWGTKFRDTYKEHITSLPDGVPYIVTDSKMVYGDSNIHLKRQELLEVVKSAGLLLDLATLNTVAKAGVEKVKKDASLKADKLLALETLAAELGYGLGAK